MHLFQLRKQHPEFNAEKLAAILCKFCDDYNLKHYRMNEIQFQPSVIEATMRQKITQYLDIRRKRQKSLLLIDAYKKVNVNSLAFKVRNGSPSRQDRKEEIEETRESSEYRESPKKFPLNFLRGNYTKK